LDPAILDRVTRALADRYRIEKRVGEGGMAVVYVAEDLKHERKVALKLLRPELGVVLGGERFLQEIRVTAKLNHPNILPLFDSGEIEGVLYYVMPYVDGETLVDRLSREGRLPVAEAVDIATEVADALAYAHRIGVIHRDVKPGNILFQAGQALIGDFGVALGVTDNREERITQQGLSVGTPEYMSPEQALADQHVDARSDVYSLGCVLYEMLVGRPPHVGKSVHDVLAKVTGDTPAGVRALRKTVPEGVDRVVQRALAKAPDQRISSAEEFSAELRGAARAAAGRSARLLRIAGAAMFAVLAAVAALTLTRDNGAQMMTVGQTRRVTHAEGLELDPAVSPGGDMIAFASGPLGHMKLHAKQVTGGRNIALTADVSGHHRWPRWSPDGSQIAFIATDSGRSEVRIVPTSGGPSRMVVQTAGAEHEIFGASWSPDGKQLVYGMRGSIYTIPVDGGESRLLVEMIDGHSPSWSPDGSRIAFVSGNPTFVFGTFVLGNIAPSSLWVVSPADSSAVQVTETTFLHMSPVWTPDGKSLVFVSNHDGSRDIHQLELDDAGRSEGTRRRLTTGLNAHTVSIAWDATFLSYSVLDMNANIWSIAIPDQGPVSASSAQPVTDDNQSIEGISITPDGHWLAYDSDVSGTQDIYRLRLGGGEPEQLTTDPRDDFYPAWTRDGSEIAFYSFRSGKRDIWTMDADGSNQNPVTTTSGHNRAPQWSPDARSIVFHSDVTGRSELFVVSREQASDIWGTPRQLTVDGGFNASWSPDGRDIAYIDDEVVRVVSADGGEPFAVAGLPSEPNAPAPWAVAWSTDGTHIYYKAFDAERRSSFWSVPLAGGTPQLLVTFNDPGFQSRRNEFGTDGTRFFFTVGFHESDLWVMDLGAIGAGAEAPDSPGDAR
jgi:serine/threonine-protein kinase